MARSVESACWQSQIYPTTEPICVNLHQNGNEHALRDEGFRLMYGCSNLRLLRHPDALSVTQRGPELYPYLRVNA